MLMMSKIVKQSLLHFVMLIKMGSENQDKKRETTFETRKTNAVSVSKSEILRVGNGSCPIKKAIKTS